MALSSFTTVLQRWTGAAYTTIAGVRDISGPSLELGTEDVTNHSSTSGYRQFVATVLGAGEVTFDLNFDPDEAQHGVPSGLIDDMRDKTLQQFNLVFPDLTATAWPFTAYVVAFESSAPVEGALSASVTLRISGVPTLA